MLRNTIARFAVAALVAVTIAAAPARAADWPNRTVTILVTMAAGGSTDLLARIAADKLSQKFGQTFIVENKPSAGGAVASTQVANSPPDGHTLLFSPSSAINLTPLAQKMTIDPREKLIPISNMATSVQFIAIKRSLPVTNLAEFFAYAKAHPGKLNFAAAGTNNLSHLTPLVLFKRAGVDVVMVPSRGETQAISDLMAGLVDFYFGNASVLMQYKDSPSIRLIAVGTAERLAAAPDIPSISETVPGFDVSSWNGFLAPVGTPEAAIEKLRAAIAEIVNTPEVSERLVKLGLNKGGQNRSEVEAAFKKDRDYFAEAAKIAGLQPQ